MLYGPKMELRPNFNKTKFIKIFEKINMNYIVYKVCAGEQKQNLKLNYRNI